VGGDLPRFQPRPEETAEIGALLASFGAGGAPVILLNPNASDLMPLRRWEPGRYVELARALLAELPEVRIVLTGAPHEAGPVARLAAEVGAPRCFSLAGRTTLRQLMVLYSLSELLVTNDSGPAHFAALTPVDVITLFGPETPALFAALTPRNTALSAGLACSPCVNAHNNRQSACTDNVCMQRITVDRVRAEALRIYRARRRG
jgi:ADP-heptose:LPS heptosyltransferase